MASVSATRLLKSELRKQIRTTLSSLPQTKISAESRRTTARFLASPEYAAAHTVAVYSSMPHEYDTSSLLADAFRQKKRVFLPRVTSKSRHEMIFLEVNSEDEIASWTPNGWGIREPPVEHGRVQALQDVGLDIIIVPGVAFDAYGARCGQGMGFYDTFLTNYRQCREKMPKLVALALSAQVVGSIPVTEHDWNVDEVLFEEFQTS